MITPNKSIDIPDKDTTVERQKFYVVLVKEMDCFRILVASEFEKLNASVLRTEIRLEKLEEANEESASNHIQTETRNKTLIASITVVWILFSAVFSWVWDKTSSKAESVIENVRKLEDDVKENKTVHINFKSEIDSVKGLKGQIMTLQSDVEGLMLKGKSQ